VAGPDARTLAAIPARRVQATVYRHVALGHNALATTGSLKQGSRWNPPGEFGAVYTSLSESTARAELLRMAQRRGVVVSDLAPRELVLLRVSLTRVLDLTDPHILSTLGIEPKDLVENDWSRTQQIARAAREAGFEAVRVPSAAGRGNNLVIFPDRLVAASQIREQERRPLVM